jgi:hypothetical protein
MKLLREAPDAIQPGLFDSHAVRNAPTLDNQPAPAKLPAPNMPAGHRPDIRGTVKRDVLTPARTAVLLAFGQSLLFLVLWLFVCLSAGAATGTPTPPGFRLEPSVYKPGKTRDPFMVAGAARASVTGVASRPVDFRLQGILFESANPSAIINDQLVTLNKIVSLSAGGVDIQVKAVEITRERVVLEVGGQQVELRMDAQESRPVQRR